MHPHPTFWRYILILSSHLHLGLPSGLFPSSFTIKTLYYMPLLSPYALHSPPISFSIWSPEKYWVKTTAKIIVLYIS
jgi:hypothetical protein